MNKREYDGTNTNVQQTNRNNNNTQQVLNKKNKKATLLPKIQRIRNKHTNTNKPKKERNNRNNTTRTNRRRKPRRSNKQVHNNNKHILRKRKKIHIQRSRHTTNTTTKILAKAIGDKMQKEEKAMTILQYIKYLGVVIKITMQSMTTAAWTAIAIMVLASMTHGDISPKSILFMIGITFFGEIIYLGLKSKKEIQLWNEEEESK